MAVKPALPIRLLVMDLDGTLLPHGGVIAERTIDAIRAARAKGVIATISSGRTLNSIRAGADRPKQARRTRSSTSGSRGTGPRTTTGRVVEFE